MDSEPEVPTAAQLDFLYRALEDAQAVIRFLDAKAAFGVAVLSAMVGKVLADLGSFFPRGEQPIWRQLLELGFLAAASIAAVIVIRIVFPVGNPTENARLLSGLTPAFYVTGLKPRSWGRVFSNQPSIASLVQDHAEYLQQIMAADTASLIRVVSGEVLKVSYIRQIKSDRLGALARVLVVCIALFVVLMAADATLPKTVRPALVHIDTPLKLEGPVRVLSTPIAPLPNPNVAAPPKAPQKGRPGRSPSKTP